ncbi:MAG: type II toxin-antitoxin system VapC family toxin [Pyrinomonadaceae bacterium]
MTKTDVRLEPINRVILRQAADLRAIQNLKTPDAVHASTAIASNCSYFVTNDNGFKRLSNFNVVVLSEII